MLEILMSLSNVIHNTPVIFTGKAWLPFKNSALRVSPVICDLEDR